jgi:uncharacterized protein YdeI (YjbR/CyaY-like superfamily)
MKTKEGLAVRQFQSPAEWEAWLAANHASSEGLWLKIAKKESGSRSVTYSEALDVALCWGWIDGQKAPLDDKFWLQRFTRRKAKSKWSKINVGRVKALIEQGRMQAPGLREIELAQHDGRWESAYDSHRTATVPEDLQQALDENPRARDFFATLSSQNRYAILYRIHDAKRPETRARRIEQFVAMLAEGKTLH